MSDPEDGNVTGRQMCELIAEYLKETRNIDITPEEIWNYSPTGELLQVFLRYAEARRWKDWTISHPAEWEACRAELAALADNARRIDPTT